MTPSDIPSDLFPEDEHPDDQHPDPASGLASSDELGSAEDQSWVSGLLRGLRADDPPIPAEVAQRVDLALAELRSNQPGRTTTGRTDPGRANRWLAIAAAAAVLLGGTALYRQSTIGSSQGAPVASDSYTALNAEATTNPETATVSEPRIIAGGAQLVSKASAAAAIATLVAAPSSAAITSTGNAAGGSAGGSASGGSAGMTGTNASEPRMGFPWIDCLMALPGTSGRAVTAVVQNITYEGQAADVIVSPADSTHLEVWIVLAGCTPSTTKVLDHQVIAT